MTCRRPGIVKRTDKPSPVWSTATEWESRAQEYEEQAQVIRDIMLGGVEGQTLDV